MITWFRLSQLLSQYDQSKGWLRKKWSYRSRSRLMGWLASQLLQKSLMDTVPDELLFRLLCQAFATASNDLSHRLLLEQLVPDVTHDTTGILFDFLLMMHDPEQLKDLNAQHIAWGAAVLMALQVDGARSALMVAITVPDDSQSSGEPAGRSLRRLCLAESWFFVGNLLQSASQHLPEQAACYQRYSIFSYERAGEMGLSSLVEPILARQRQEQLTGSGLF